jgi:hypothetical protein
MKELVLVGINGGNPLGFMAALGTALTVRRIHPQIKLAWRVDGGFWRPVIHGSTSDREEFIHTLLGALKNSSLEPFEIESKLPFSVDVFMTKLRLAQLQATPDNRRCVDFLCAYGTEVHPDKGVFIDTSLRMVRSGDSKGNGLPAYAIAIRNLVDADALKRTLFEIWHYQDNCPILRWDPSEDQRYALVWNNPEDKAKKQLKSMLGANALAIESLVLFPVIPEASNAITTGFHHSGRHEFFTWPLWYSPVSMDVVRSLLSLQELHRDKPNRQVLAAQGIKEIYRCERIMPNKYYRNFSPAMPV